MSAYRFGVVGEGWRSGFYERVARTVPSLLTMTGVVSRAAGTDSTCASDRNIRRHASTSEMLAADRPDFVIVSVPPAAAGALVTELVEAGVPTLAETPPATDLESLQDLWACAGSTGLVQVAEQNPRYPGHSARRKLVEDGYIGQPTSVHVSSTHEYHAVALIRHLLDAGFGPVQDRASEFSSSLVDPVTRDGWAPEKVEEAATTVIATIDFGGTMGLYDFTTNQWFNPLRTRRMVVRGTRGEIVDTRVTRISGPGTVLESPIIRRQTGYDLDLTGYRSDHISYEGEVIWRSPFGEARLSDEEHAIASLLAATGAWARDGRDEPYPLAEGCQDHAIALAIQAALSSGTTEALAAQPWSR